MSNLDKHLDKLNGTELFNTLDLSSGYLQVPIAAEDRHKTAFITPDDSGEFTRMIFGLMNASFNFSKFMSKVLEPLRKQWVLFYLDDMLIAGKNWLDLKETLILVLKALRNAKLILNLTKCTFFREKVQCLGHMVTKEDISPTDSKVNAIQNFLTPANVHELLDRETGK